VLLLLDTHVWVWNVEGEARRIGRRTRRLISRAESRNDVRISPATAFEIATLHTLGRLHLARPPEQWVRNAFDSSGARLAELSVAIAIDAGSIPRTALTDPVDRLLVATARQLNATFLTRDAAILRYAKTTRSVLAYDAAT
jgi:PIN domain nuclease of toxin-antitoxin system